MTYRAILGHHFDLESRYRHLSLEPYEPPKHRWNFRWSISLPKHPPIWQHLSRCLALYRSPMKKHQSEWISIEKLLTRIVERFACITTCTIVSFGNAFKYLQLKYLKLQLWYTGHSIVSQFISELTMARCRPVGSRPIARQNSITCITGNAKIKSITLQNTYEFSSDYDSFTFLNHLVFD